jgi:rare lipoprotein A (peptidoglycan hydrolase)
MRTTTTRLLMALVLSLGSALYSSAQGLVDSFSPTPVTQLFPNIVYTPDPVLLKTPVVLYEGTAAWYGSRCHQGHLMANGKRFSRNNFTAASLTLPLGTRIRVFNLSTGRSVHVTITDRGPYTKGRILDLAWAPAHVIGCTVTGTCWVQYTIEESP